MGRGASGTAGCANGCSAGMSPSKITLMHDRACLDERLNIALSPTFPAEVAAHRCSAPDETILVQVANKDFPWSGKYASLEFRMKLSTSFWKMIDRWCKYQELPACKVRFHFVGGEVKPEDTPGSCGWSAARGKLEIIAEEWCDEELV